MPSPSSSSPCSSTWWAFGLIWPVMPRLIEEVSGSDLAGASAWMAGCSSPMACTQFLFGPAIGNLSDAYGAQAHPAAVGVRLAVDYLLMAWRPIISGCSSAGIVAGVCGASYTTANAYLADITKPEERAKAFGMMGAAFGLGFIIGPAIGGLLGEFGPRVPFSVAAGLSIAEFRLWLFRAARNLAAGEAPALLAAPAQIPSARSRSSPAIAAWCRWGLSCPAISWQPRSIRPSGPSGASPAFGWSEATIGLTLAAFGLVMAIIQGVLTGPSVK